MSFLYVCARFCAAYSWVRPVPVHQAAETSGSSIFIHSSQSPVYVPVYTSSIVPSRVNNRENYYSLLFTLGTMMSEINAKASAVKQPKPVVPKSLIKTNQ